MDKNKIIRIFLTFITAGLFLAGCAPASINSRYYSNDDEKKEEQKNSEADDIFIFRNEETPSFMNDSFIGKYEDLLAEGLNIPPITKMYIEIIRYIKTPYLYGGESPSGMDCSGFTSTIFRNAFGIELPRTSADQSRMEGTTLYNISDMMIGDLVFFKISNPREVDHVGIYLGEGKFAHAGASTGVIVSSFDTNYFLEHFYLGKRILPTY